MPLDLFSSRTGIAVFVTALLLLAAVTARVVRDPGVGRVEEALRSRWAPWVAGLVCAIAVMVAWGGVNRLPMFHDEKAYLLQAEIFASGRWTAPGRVLPEFFEQAHVLVTPVLAEKYFPGHALALVPGIWLGAPGLMVIVLSGLTGALAFALARRVAGPWVALLTSAVWLASYEQYGWHATYFSETTTGALYLATWWALLEWRDRPRARMLALAALFAGLCIVTRPLTGVALALPAAVWVLVRAVRVRPVRWADLGAGAAAAVAVLAIIPLWSARTTGSWRLTPQTQYTRDYMPYDVPGFGVIGGPPRRPVPPDLANLNALYLYWHAAHKPDSLPGLLVDRAKALTLSAWHDARPPLVAAALVGAAALPAAVWLALGTVALHLLLYLTYAHPDAWTLYYAETLPVLAFVAALGLWRVYGWLMAVRPKGDEADRLARQGATAVLASCVFAWSGVRAIARVQREMSHTQGTFARVDAAMNGLPGKRVLVFVRYPVEMHPGLSFVKNAPLQDTARVWTAYDRGEDNARLLRLAPDRVPYLFDMGAGRIVPLAEARPGVPRPHGYVAAPGNVPRRTADATP